MTYFLLHKDKFILSFFCLLAIFGLYFYGTAWFIYSIIAYYLIYHIFQPCWWHYDLWHWGLIKSNQIVHSIHVLLYCFFYPHSPEGPIKVHLLHHKHYNSDKDQNTTKVHQGRLKHLFNLTKNKRIRTEKVKFNIPDFFIWGFCCKNYLAIFIITNIACLFIVPKYYIFFHVIPFILGKYNLVVKVHDIVWHYDPNKNFKNKWYMFFLSFTDAWHVDHHATPIILNFGPSIFKWINPQFYYLCLIDKNIRKSVFNFSNYKYSRQI